MEQKRGGFLIHNGHLDKKQNGQYSSPDRSKMVEVLIFYKNIEFIRTSVKRGRNYVDYVVKEDKNSSTKKAEQNYLSRRVQLYKLIDVLPDYFIQVNRSEIINIFHITGRSGKYLFTEQKEFKITKTFEEKVNEMLLSFFNQ